MQPMRSSLSKDLRAPAVEPLNMAPAAFGRSVKDRAGDQPDIIHGEGSADEPEP